MSEDTIMSQLKLEQATINQAQRLFAYFPYRRIWVVSKGGQQELICKNTAHTANSYAKKGYQVCELKRTNKKGTK